jgi:hypothetical protein
MSAHDQNRTLFLRVPVTQFATRFLAMPRDLLPARARNFICAGRGGTWSYRPSLPDSPETPVDRSSRQDRSRRSRSSTPEQCR